MRAQPLTSAGIRGLSFACILAYSRAALVPQSNCSPSGVRLKNYFSATIGVRPKLALLVVSCVLPLSVVAGGLLFVHYEIALSEVKNANVQRVRAIAASLDRKFTITQAKLSVLDSTSMSAEGDLSYSRGKALETLDGISADSIILMDAQGKILYSTRHLHGTVIAGLGNSAALEAFLAKEKPAVSDLFSAPGVNAPMVAVGVPLKSRHRFGYSLNALMTSGRVSSILSEHQFPENWRATIVDSQGRVVARSHSIDKFLGKTVSSAVVKGVKTVGEGSVETQTLDGIPVLTMYSRAPVSGWAVTLGIPTAELKAPIRTTLGWLAVAVSGALAIGLVLSWLIGGQIARSIQNLVGSARALGSGMPVKVEASKFREADELSQALVEAAAQLKRSKFAALHDSLTGLPNRSAFDVALEHHILLCSRNETTFALLFVDLDGFKGVNDKHGHGAGDRLLCLVAERLQGSIRSSDLAARIGGDEFAVLLIQSDDDDAVEFADRLVGTLSAPYNIGKVTVRISASVGVACGPRGHNGDSLIKLADEAMYCAKSLGKARVSLAPNPS